VLLDLVGHGLQAPVLDLGHGPAMVLDDLLEGLGQRLDLCGRDVLACDIDALIERHSALLAAVGGAALRPARSGASRPRLADRSQRSARRGHEGGALYIIAPRAQARAGSP